MDIIPKTVTSAYDVGLSREILYKALPGERTPSLDTVLKVLGAPDRRLRAEALPAGQGPIMCYFTR